jgi:hypothetical protein
MKCWNPECESTNADEFCIATWLNECEDVPEIEYVEDQDDSDCKLSESDTLATSCGDCGKITYRHDWTTTVLQFLSPRWQSLTPLILPKEGA